MILDRFDAIVFIGDSMLQNVYSAFNMLLRENVALGGLKQWNLKDGERSSCHCDNQIMRPECFGQSITSSAEVRENDGGSNHRSPYYCERKLHLSNSISALFIKMVWICCLRFHRHTPHLPPYQRLPRFVLSSLRLHEYPLSLSRLIQACPRDSLPLS